LQWTPSTRGGIPLPLPSGGIALQTSRLEADPSMKQADSATPPERRFVIEQAVTRALSESDDISEAAPRIIRAICETMGWACGARWAAERDGDTLICAESWSVASPGLDGFLETTRSLRHTRQPDSLIGRTWLGSEPVWISDLMKDGGFRRGPDAIKAGLRSAFAFPVKAGAEVTGVMEFFGRDSQHPGQALLDGAAYIGNGIGRFLRRAEAQERLRESEERFQSTIELVAVGIAHVDTGGRFIQTNSRLCELLGYTREELLGMTVGQILHPDDVRATEEALAQLHAGLSKSIRTEQRYLRKDGSVVWVGWTIAVKRSAAGEPLYDIYVWEDISARKQSEEALRMSEERFRGLVNLSSDWYWEQDAQFRFTWISKEQVETSGSHAMLGLRRWDLPGLAPLSGSWDEHRKTLGAHQPYRDFECLRLESDGAARYLSVSGEPIFDGRGCFQGYRGTGRDLTAYKREEHLLRLEHTVTRSLAEAETASAALTAVIRVVCEAEGWPCGEYWGVDEAAGTMRFGGFWDALDDESREIFQRAHKFEFPPGVGLAGRIWQSGEPLWIADVSKDTRMLRRELAREAGLRGAFLFPCFAEGKMVGIFSFWSRVIREPDARLLQAIRVIGSQIGQFVRRKQTEERIQHLATHDGLSGLPNRLMFSELLGVEIESSRRYERRFAVLFIDLDRFKIVNDTLGHHAGDALLKEISVRLKGALRASDVVARVGGDEFVALVREIGDTDQAAVIARKILSAVMKPVKILDQECRVTASIGISIFPADACDEQSLMKNADLAMYLAKEEGKNNCQFYSEAIQARSIEKMTLESRLHGALERNEFSLHYQAKVNLKSGTITGVEALLRWNNPELEQPGTRRSAPGTADPDRRGDGSHRSDRQMGAQNGVRAERRLAGAGPAAPVHGGQSVAAPVRRSGPRFGYRRRSAGNGHDARAARDRNHREHGDAQCRSGGARARCDKGARRAPGGRRLRYRLLVAVAAQAFSDRHAEGGSVVHPRHPPRRRGQGHHGGDHRAGPHTWPHRRGRRRRNQRTAKLPARAGLR
jgi:diguanylate cyclase (GGDEF)-like protein/PAS domain S-box-containing protein